MMPIFVHTYTCPHCYAAWRGESYTPGDTDDCPQCTATQLYPVDSYEASADPLSLLVGEIA